MKKLLLALLVLSSNVVWAQNDLTSSLEQLGADAKPASSNVTGQDYPKIDSMRRTEFRLHAPSAQKVQVDIGGHKYDMVKDEGGTGQW